MIYVFLGKEVNILKQEVNDLIKSLNISNVIKYDSSDTSINEVLNEVNYIDLFNEQKLIILSDFSFKSLKEKEEKEFISYIEHMGDNVIIIKCSDDSLDERKKVTKLLREKCKVVELKKLDYKELHSYIEKMIKDEGHNITFNQVKKILNLCEYNTDITINEVNKLLLYKIGVKDITDEDIDNVISKNNEKIIFSLIDCVLDKNIAGCFETYNILRESNTDETIIVESIAKQVRLLFQIKELIKNATPINIARMLGVKEYTVSKLVAYTNKYTDEELANILYKLSDVDVNFKVYSSDKVKELEMFFLSL